MTFCEKFNHIIPIYVSTHAARHGNLRFIKLFLGNFFFFWYLTLKCITFLKYSKKMIQKKNTKIECQWKHRLCHLEMVDYRFTYSKTKMEIKITPSIHIKASIGQWPLKWYLSKGCLAGFFLSWKLHEYDHLFFPLFLLEFFLEIN